MGPVPKRIPQEPRHRAGKGEELFVRLRTARDVGFRDSIRSHCPPLVVIPSQPNLGQVRPLLVLRNLFRRKVAVIIVNRLFRCGVVKPASRFCRKEKVVLSNRIFNRDAFSLF